MNRKQMRACHIMDLKHFLLCYYGVDNMELLEKLSMLSHRELKMIAGHYGINMVKTSFDYINKEQIADGTIILVNDAYNNPAPYVNPNRTLVREYETELDASYIDEVVEEREFDKKGRQRILRKIIKFRRDE